MSKLKSGLLFVTLGCCAVCGQLSAFSQSEPVRVSQQSNQNADKPRSGQSMQQVEDVYGTPVERTSAVGEPPITRWHYATFTVYFEHDRVIHAVAHRS